jgi:hypothetical protein
MERWQDSAIVVINQIIKDGFMDIVEIFQKAQPPFVERKSVVRNS